MSGVQRRTHRWQRQTLRTVCRDWRGYAGSRDPQAPRVHRRTCDLDRHSCSGAEDRKNVSATLVLITAALNVRFSCRNAAFDGQAVKLSLSRSKRESTTPTTIET